MEKEYLTDGQIIGLFQARDQAAIEQTQGKYGKFIFGTVYSILGNKEDCDECVNDTYLKLWNSIPPDEPKNFVAYIAVFARRIAIDRYRHNHSGRRIPPGLSQSLDDFQDLMTNEGNDSQELLKNILNQFLAELSRRRRLIFVGRYYFSKPVSVVAEELGYSLSTVNKEIAEIKKALTEKLKLNGIEV